MLEVTMSRTAHHTRSPKLHVAPRRDRVVSDPWRIVTVIDLRYSASELRAAGAAGRRPSPQRVRRRVEFHSYLGAYGRGRTVAEDSNLDERRERRRLREKLLEIRRRANTLPTGGTCEVDDDFDVHPFRHRHGVLWQAW
ncbi:hypothetical protein [Streptosporangium minutum]|uniref:hypothetical protein n=1 Tax=Streptosporangium minutum TaxID=569862 RepID=UPI0010541437|nr:hypothetical protein [Streptosporangium minutum]